MSFSEKQMQALRRQPNRSRVRTRVAHGRELSYLEGWYAISEANRIFGFDGWNRETVEAKCALARENRGTFLTGYIARVRVTVHADGAIIIREGHGTGEGHGSSPGEMHDIALKAAETDATKRALATFGKPFGLELYRGGKAKAVPPPSISAAVPDDARLGFHPDEADPQALPLLWSPAKRAGRALSGRTATSSAGDGDTRVSSTAAGTRNITGRYRPRSH
jgi:DNA recombination protein Rad52